LAAKSRTVGSHPPYSSDFTPCDFITFPRKKLHRFQNIPEIQQQSLTPTTKKSVPAVLSVAEMLDPLHKVKHSDFATQISNEQISLEVGST